MARIVFNPFLCPVEDDDNHEGFRILSHMSFFSTCEILKKAQKRFPTLRDDRINNDMMLLFLSASKKYLEHRSPAHLSRLILSIHILQRSLQTAMFTHPQQRHLMIRWIPTRLSFPFTSKSVLGCLVGFNLIDRYELFDEENVLLVLRKNFPSVRLVRDSSYTHFLPDKNLRILYFEIEKTDGTQFTLAERQDLVNTLKRQIRGGFEKVAPMVFMRRNEEEVHKTILTLSREIQSLQDIPQAWISFERQAGDEIIFVVTLVYVSPKRHFPLHQQFSSVPDCTFISERIVTVRHLLKHPIEAHVFRLHLNRSLAFVRSDGSLDFYASRQKVVSLINDAIGEFRDYNGGGIIKQRELLDDLKGKFPWIAQSEPELLESFFYEITPLEQQTLLAKETLCTLFQEFLNNYSRQLPTDISYVLNVRKTDKNTFISIQGQHASWKQAILNVVEQPIFSDRNFIYSALDIPEGLFFHGVLPKGKTNEKLINALQMTLEELDQRDAKRQILRIGMEYGVVTLDPRVSVDHLSEEVLSLLFEGLTRVGENGLVDNGLAETIEISEDRTQYIFRLRRALWNNGDPVKASDFEYAWKKALSSRSNVNLTHFLHHIKNAKAARNGEVPPNVGIMTLDDRTLKVDLEHPAPYFLEFTALPIFYPVHQQIDQSHPQWPYQTGHSYPCNGSFQLVVNDPNLQTYRLTKNPNYWNSASVILDEILLTQIDPRQALQMFRNEKLDWIGHPFGRWHDFFTPSTEDRKINLPGTSICWMLLNTLQPPLSHPKIRRSFELAIDRDALVKDASMPTIPAYSLLDPLFNAQQQSHRPNIEQAQRLLLEGLSELGLHIDNLPVFELLHHPGDAREESARRLSEQLHNHLGINCQPKPMPWSAIFSKMIQGEFQMCFSRWNSPTRDPITTLSIFRYAQGSMNVTGWEHPTFQRWLNLSDQEIDPTRRMRYLQHAEQCLTEEVPVIFLFHEPRLALVKQTLETIDKQTFDIVRCYQKPNRPATRSMVST